MGPGPALNSAHSAEGMTLNERKAPEMSVVVVVAAFPFPEHRAELIAAFEAAITRVHDAGVELYALHEGTDRLVMIEKYESEQARSEHAKGAALADTPSLRPAILSTHRVSAT